MDSKMKFVDPSSCEIEEVRKKKECLRRKLWQITDKYLSEMSYYFIHPHP